METPITKSQQFMSNKDTPIELADLTKLDTDERENLLLGIRERRLYAAKIYEEAKSLKEAAAREKCLERLEHELEMFAKEAVRADRAIEKLEKRITNLRGIEMEIEG